MNRKGFTLVELLGVIAILGILAVLIIPSVENIINKNKEKGLENQKNTIKLAAKNWLTDNKKLIDGDEVIVTIEDLKQQGYLELNIINPITNKCISNQNEVLIKLDGKKYSYKFNGGLRDGDDEDCGNINSKPHIYLFGKNSIILKQGEEFLEPGFSATTVDGEDISRNVEIIGEVDSSTIGEYEISYSVTDNGITSIKKRKVKVADDEKPYIHHPGTTLLLNSISTFDVLEDVYAVDNSGETIEVKAFTNLTLGITGEYKIIYYAKDSSGNEHEVTRKLIIKNNDNTIYNAIKNNANVYNADFDIQDLINGTSNVYSGVHDITLKEFIKDYYRNRKIFGNNNANNWVRIKDSVYRIIEFSNDFISLVYKKTCSGDICEGNGLITDQQFKVYGKDEVVISPDSSKNEIRKIQTKWVESQKIDKYLVSAKTMVNHPTLMGYLNIYRHYDQYTSGEKTAEQLRSEGIQNFSEDLIKEYKYNILSSYNANCLIHLYTQYGINSIYFISNENDTNTYITDFNPDGLDELQERNYTEEMYYTVFQIGNQVYGGITHINETNTNTFQTVINVSPYLKISKGSGTESDPYVLVP